MSMVRDSVDGDNQNAPASAIPADLYSFPPLPATPAYAPAVAAPRAARMTPQSATSDLPVFNSAMYDGRAWPAPNAAVPGELPAWFDRARARTDYDSPVVVDSSGSANIPGSRLIGLDATLAILPRIAPLTDAHRTKLLALPLPAELVDRIGAASISKADLEPVPGARGESPLLTQWLDEMEQAGSTHPAFELAWAGLLGETETGRIYLDIKPGLVTPLRDPLGLVNFRYVTADGTGKTIRTDPKNRGRAMTVSPHVPAGLRARLRGLQSGDDAWVEPVTIAASALAAEQMFFAGHPAIGAPALDRAGELTQILPDLEVERVVIATGIGGAERAAFAKAARAARVRVVEPDGRGGYRPEHVPEVREPAAATDTHVYELRPDGTWIGEPRGNEIKWTRLATFQARIAAEVSLDDGGPEGPQKHYEIKARLMSDAATAAVPEPQTDAEWDRYFAEAEQAERDAERAEEDAWAAAASFEIPVGDFDGLKWIAEKVPGKAFVLPGVMKAKEHFAAAVKQKSPDWPQRRKYAQTGCRTIKRTTGGQQCGYLSGSGAIFEDGLDPSVQTALGCNMTGLGRFSLPEPLTGDQLIEATRAAMLLLELAPLRISATLLGAAFLAPLQVPDFNIWLGGITGAGKSGLAAFVQSFWGTRFTYKSLPANWYSSEGAIFDAAHRIADAVLVVDEFKYRGNEKDIAQLNAKADHVLQNSANGAGRATLTRNREYRAGKPTRSLILSTGEAVPPGESLRSRLLIHPLARGDVDMGLLRGAGSAHASEGRLAGCMASYIKRLLPSRERLRAGLHAQREQLCQNLRGDVGGHERHVGKAADLIIGLESFFEFAAGVGALTAHDAAARLAQCRAGCLEAVIAQKDATEGESPLVKFKSTLAAALAAKVCHIADPSGGEPRPMHASINTDRIAEDIGWLFNAELDRRVPGGKLIGWMERREQASGTGHASGLGPMRAPRLWLSPEQVLKLLHERGERTLTIDSIGDALDAAGLLVEKEPGRKTARKTVAANRQRVWVIPFNTFWE